MTFIVGVGCLVLLLQMLAVSQLSSSQSGKETEVRGTQPSPPVHNVRPKPLHVPADTRNKCK